MRKVQRTINFDLDTNALKEHYNKSRSSAYREIQNFLKDNGFYHRQFSGYVSRSKMTDMDVMNLSKKMWAKMPWLEKCAKVFDVAEVGKKFDLILERERQKTKEVTGQMSLFENQDKQNLQDWRKSVDRTGNNSNEIGLNKQQENTMDAIESEKE